MTMKCFLFGILLVLTVNSAACYTVFHGNSALQNGNDSSVICRQQLPGLQEAIAGGLLYLRERQISSLRVKLQPDDFRLTRTRKTYGINSIRSFLGTWLFTEKHQQGAWPGFVTFLPTRGPAAWKPITTATDYNLFTTASTLYCLYRFDESLLPSGSRFVANMRNNALVTFGHFRHNDTYRFWKIRRTEKESYPYTAPENIPLWMLSVRQWINKKTGWWGLNGFHESDYISEWIHRIYNPVYNKTGARAMFNIPADTDDTSLAVTMLLLDCNDNPQREADSVALAQLNRYRDQNRLRRDRWNSHTGENTGAFLTWHKDENTPVFGQPDMGIIPLENNNVDLVVNCNALLALGAAGMTHTPRYAEVLKLLSRAVKYNLWQRGNIYYPEPLWFPYALSRAISEADGGIPEADTLFIQLTEQLLRMEQKQSRSHPESAGSFAPFDSVSTVTATALGLNALLNMGRKYAVTTGMTAAYDSIVNASARYLLESRKSYKTKTYPNEICYWQSGPLFSSSVHELAYWYSNSLNTALVIDALSKYVAYTDYSTETRSKKKLPIYIINGKYSVDFSANSYQ